MIYSLLIKSTIKGQAMKYTVPEEYQTQFNTLIRSVPVELQDDNEFKETVLVYLKMGGISLARRYAETTARYLNVDVLELGTGLRFPKVVEVKQEDESDEENENEEENEDENEGEDNDDDDDDDKGTKEEKKPE
jgi:hypothetical protein